MVAYLQENPSNYTFEFDFLWVLGGLALLVLIAMAVTLPYRLLRLAYQNRVRLDGSISRRRTRREARHLADFVGNLLIVPLLVIGCAGGILMAVHSYIIPIPLVTDIASLFDPDPAVWEERTETGRLGDVGVLYGRWSRSQGFSAQRAYFWRTFLKQHWLPLAVGAALLGIFGYWFMTGYYVSTVARYQQGILQRRAHYRKIDRAGRHRSRS